MKLNIYAVHDNKVKAYGTPFFQITDGQAIRAFQDNVNSTTESQITKHPEDFTLFKLGEYDDQTGIINHPSSDIKILTLGNGKTYQQKAEQIDESKLNELHTQIEYLSKQLDAFQINK